jgi:NAD(P)-dependent dehydrogenase (short-subunit alcohol dehydrogenase family)
MILKKFSLAGRVAVVTGSGRGIGKGIALGFADAGADVVVLARTVPEIEETATEIRKIGRRSLAIPTDVTQAEQVKNMVKTVVKEFGRVDILVNNAGGGFSAPVLEMSEAGWNAVISLNLHSCFLCSKTVAEVMVKQRNGCIINITSPAGIMGIPGLAHYGAAKAGIINFTQTLAGELGSRKIRVNAISCGTILTENLKKVIYPTPEKQAEAAKYILMGRVGQPEDIALAAIFLASDASSWVTGQTFYINGGLAVSA